MQAEYRLQYQIRARSPSFARKVERSLERMRKFREAADRPYIGWSGGKDSTAVMLLAAEAGYTDMPVLTQADDLDWPEKRAHCHALVTRLGFGDYEYRESQRSAAEQFEQAEAGQAITGTFSHVIRQYVRDRSRDGVMLGLRMDESRQRKMTILRRGYVNRADDGWRCYPIADWSGEDVFALIVSRDAPYMSLYDCDDDRAPHEWRMSWPATPGFWRTGGAAELRRYFPQHFARLAELNPSLRDYA